jgi:uncharacterized membrane protein
VFYLFGRLFGWYSSLGEFGIENKFDPTNLYLIGRATSVLFGVFTVPVVYWLGRAAYSKTIGLLASAFLAVTFIHVRDSHYAVNDIATTLFVTLALVGAIMLNKRGSSRWYVFSGIAVGLGFATKYSAIISVIPILIAHFIRPSVKVTDIRKLNLRPLLLFIAVCLLVSVAASPYFILDFGQVVQDINSSLYQAGQAGFDGWEIDQDGSIAYYVKSLIWGLGFGLFVLSLIGACFALLRHRKVDIIIVSLPIVFFIAASSQSMYFARFLLPIVPVLLVLSALVLTKALKRIIQNTLHRGLALAAVSLILLIQPAAASLRHDYLLTQSDTRTLAKQWIDSNISAGSRIAVDWPFHGPPLATSAIKLPNSMESYDVTVVGGHGLSDNPLSWYAEEEFDYIVASSFIWEIGLVDTEANRRKVEFYLSLEDKYDCLKQFTPYRSSIDSSQIFDDIYGPVTDLWQRNRPGPILKVCRIA